jgi:RNA polymerase sigma-70 factor (ECF subfamily)
MQIPDAVLVEQSRSGDRRAFEQLFQRYGAAVYGFLRRLTAGTEDAQDLAEEVFVRAWTRLASLKDGGAFRTWLFRIAVRLAQDHRKAQRAPTSSLTGLEHTVASEERPPEEAVLSAERQQVVRRAIDRLSEEHREVVTLFYQEGMSVDTISKVLRVPKGTVVSRLSRARAALRKDLAEYIRPGAGGEEQ